MGTMTITTPDVILSLIGGLILALVGLATHLWRQRDVLFATIIVSTLFAMQSSQKIAIHWGNLSLGGTIWKPLALFLIMFSAYRYGYRHARLILACLAWGLGLALLADFHFALIEFFRSPASAVPIDADHVRSIVAAAVAIYLGGLIGLAVAKRMPHTYTTVVISTLTAVWLLTPVTIAIKVLSNAALGPHFLGLLWNALFIRTASVFIIATVFAVLLRKEVSDGRDQGRTFGRVRANGAQQNSDG